MAGLSGVPIIILKEGSKRETGKEAQRRNILAAKAVAEAIRTTLGPKGMDKMLIAGEEATITNDGATILREMDIEHPVAKMIVEVAKAQDDEIGDGTTTAVIIAGKLLEKAEALLDLDVHPTVIVQGYKQAAARAQEVLSATAIDVSGDERVLLKIAQTAMRGKGIEIAMDKLAKIAVDAARAVAGFEGKDIEENVKTVLIPGGKIDGLESKLRHSNREGENIPGDAKAYRCSQDYAPGRHSRTQEAGYGCQDHNNGSQESRRL